MKNLTFFYYFLVLHFSLLQFNTLNASAPQPEKGTLANTKKAVKFNPTKVFHIISKTDKPNHHSVQQHHQTQDPSNLNPVFLPQPNENTAALTHPGKRSILKDTFQHEVELQRPEKEKREAQEKREKEIREQWKKEDKELEREERREARAAYKEKQRVLAQKREQRAREALEYKIKVFDMKQHVENQNKLKKAIENKIGEKKREAKKRCLKKSAQVTCGCLAMTACIVVIVVVPLGARSTPGQSNPIQPNNTTATNNTSIARSLNATVFNPSHRAPGKTLYQNNTRSTLARLSKLYKR